MSLNSDRDPQLMPELKLRMTPKPVLRLSPKVLIGGTVLIGLGIGTAVIFAMQPSKARGVKTQDEVYSTKNKPVSERVTALPGTYGDIPKLGPPLPGDLGKSILAAQSMGQNLGPAPSSGPDPSAPAVSQPVSASNLSAPTQVAEAQNQAHASALFTTGTRALSLDAPPGVMTSVPIASPALEGLGAVLSEHGTTPTNRAVAFLDKASDRMSVSPERLQAPASPYLVQAGSVVPAALITGIRSDLPGQVSAQITETIYDSLTGQIVLIPQGSRLIGQYDNVVAFGQSRILLAWTRLILPNGKSLILDKLSADDPQGLAGVSDRVDFHWGDMLKAGALSTLLSVGAEAGSSNKDSDIVKALRSGTADSVSRTGQQIVERQLNIQPTLTIRPGYPVRVILSRDLVLEPYGN